MSEEVRHERLSRSGWVSVDPYDISHYLEKGQVIRTLRVSALTPPTPDKLALAVEALERAREDIVGWYECVRLEDHHKHTRELLEEDLSSIDQALATIKAAD